MEQYNRILVGSVVSVSYLTNRVTLSIPEITSDVVAPIAYPFVSLASGIRFLPRVGDSVLVGFGTQITPRILGYYLDDQQHQANLDLSRRGQCWYRSLEPGDIVIYSGSGETELFLSNSGLLRIGSGVNILSLDSLRRSIEGVCGSFNMSTLNGVSVAGGNPVRTLPSSNIPQVIPNMVALELAIQGMTGKVVEMKAGNVLDDLGVSEVGDTGPKAFSLKVFAGAIPIGELYFDPLTIGVKAPNLDLDGNTIRLGGLLAITPAVLGAPLVTLLTDMLTNLITLCGAVKAKEGMDSVVDLVEVNLQTLITTVAGILSERVFLT